MFRGNELERLYRDVRCGGFHPGNDALTHELVGKSVLGVLAEQPGGDHVDQLRRRRRSQRPQGMLDGGVAIQAGPFVERLLVSVVTELAAQPPGELGERGVVGTEDAVAGLRRARRRAAPPHCGDVRGG